MRLAATLVIFFLIGCHAQADRPGTAAVVVRDGSDNVLTVRSFERIQRFILNEGQRRTYCNKFNNNPYWAFTDFNVYLNPPDQRNINCEIGRSEFNDLVVQVSRTGPTRYWNIHLDKEKRELQIRQHSSEAAPSVLTERVSEFFQKALSEIQEQAGKSDIEKTQGD
jgi:hypothetical protein